MQATDAIVTAVGKVERKVTGPFTTAARGIVFGLFIFVLGVTAIDGDGDPLTFSWSTDCDGTFSATPRASGARWSPACRRTWSG